MPHKTMLGEDIAGIGLFLTTVGMGLANFITNNSELINTSIVIATFVLTIPYLVFKALSQYEDWKDKK